ncbi:GDYXXLXY domain-containing protein [Bdellovibrio sp. HCB274]|uniref:GDYXXLXY domain-containing protein n=1 Tax=Bdellovibrio sp. HCB274 TaxID=3394361 RepID=UPI0039B4CE46
MKKMIAAVAIPCVVLLSLALYNQHFIMTGPVFEFEIEGYDPRDILAGHYLRFRIKYATDTKCTISYGPANMCLKPQQRVMEGDDVAGCENWIAGRCENALFRDDLDRFYIPQDRSLLLESQLIAGHASVQVVVGKGNALIKDLLVNGKPWTDVQKNQSK